MKEVTKEEFDKVRAMALANMHMIRAILYVIRQRNLISEQDGLKIIESIKSGLDGVPERDPILEKVVLVLETFLPSLK